MRKNLDDRFFEGPRALGLGLILWTAGLVLLGLSAGWMAPMGVLLVLSGRKYVKRAYGLDCWQ